MDFSATVLCVHRTCAEATKLVALLRDGGHRAYAVPGLDGNIKAPDFDRPQIVLLEQTHAEALRGLARALWPEAVILEFSADEEHPQVLTRVQAAL